MRAPACSAQMGAESVQIWQCCHSEAPRGQVLRFDKHKDSQGWVTSQRSKGQHHTRTLWESANSCVTGSLIYFISHLTNNLLIKTAYVSFCKDKSIQLHLPAKKFYPNKNPNNSIILCGTSPTLDQQEDQWSKKLTRFMTPTRNFGPENIQNKILWKFIKTHPL